MLSKHLKKPSELVWYGLLLLLPFTSLPIASKILKSEMVAAPSIIFLIFLLPFFILALFRKTSSLKQISFPILLFGIIAIVSSLLSFWLPIPIQKDFSIINNIIEGLVTLFIGISFYLISIHFFQSEDVFKKSLRIIIFSFIPLLIWCLFQFIFGQILQDYPNWMVQFQKLLTTSGILYKDRLTGFAYEPSWLAHQMNMFYLPIWLGTSITRKSAFGKWKNIFIIEDLFLLASIFILFFTKSRVGYITFILSLSYLFYLLNQIFVRKVKEKYKLNERRLLIKLLPVILILIFILLLIIGLFFFSKLDSRMESLFNLNTYKNRSIYSIANDFVFAERILYWQTGWKIFNDFPIFGVGLSNSGFFFRDYLPSFAWALDEPRHLIFQAAYQGNIKNLWFRLLSETGISGFVCFLTWLILIFFNSNQNQKSDQPMNRYLGIVGKLALIAILIEGFSIDSFALPYYWIMLGFVSINFKKPFEN